MIWNGIHALGREQRDCLVTTVLWLYCKCNMKILSSGFLLKKIPKIGIKNLFSKLQKV